MSNLFIAFVAAFFLPLLFHSWRVAAVALGLQGMLLGMMLASHQYPWSPQLALEYASLFLVRGLFVPWYLFRRMRGHDVASDFSLVSKNLVQWTAAFMLLLAAFVFGEMMSPHDSREALQVGTAAGAILIGLLVLANQNHPFGQIFGLLTFEGGIAFVELLSPHAMPFPVSVLVSLALLVLVLTCGQYLSRILAISPGSKDVEDEVVL